MSESPLTITYAAPAASEAKDLLQIEQEPWAALTGKVTRAEMVRYLASLIYGTEYRSSINCGLVAGEVVCVLHVHPRVSGLVYQLHTSHGSLSTPYRDQIAEEESLSFRLDTSITTPHPARNIISATWLSECYDAAGAVVDAPPLTIDGEAITIPYPVYGSVTVMYITERHSYILTAPRRDDAIDNAYSAAVYGVYAGGITWLQIDMPPGIETFQDDADCGWGATGTIVDPDDEPLPVSDGQHTRTTVVDYCSYQVISDEVS